VLACQTLSDIFSIIVLSSHFIEETIINLRCEKEKAKLCTSLWFFSTVMAHGVLEHSLFMSQFIIIPFAPFHASFAFQHLVQIVVRIKFMLHSRRINRNHSNSEMVIAVCRRVYEHITEIGANNLSVLQVVN